jgi:hypothetical protein
MEVKNDLGAFANGGILDLALVGGDDLGLEGPELVGLDAANADALRHFIQIFGRKQALALAAVATKDVATSTAVMPTIQEREGRAAALTAVDLLIGLHSNRECEAKRLSKGTRRGAGACSSVGVLLVIELDLDLGIVVGAASGVFRVSSVGRHEVGSGAAGSRRARRLVAGGNNVVFFHFPRWQVGLGAESTSQ